MKKSCSVSIQSILIYVVIIGFLFPRGYNGVSGLYHKISSAAMWIAVILTWVQWIKISRIKSRLSEGKTEKFILRIGTYFILAIILTLVSRKSLSSGFQQMFAAPSVCVFMILNLKRNPKKILNIIVNVLCLEFTINTLLRPSFHELYHTIFLGHIQVVSQYGILSILVTVLSWILYHEHKKKLIYLFVVTLYTMLTTDAELAVLTAAGFLVAFIIYKCKFSQIFMLRSEFYVLAMVGVSIAIVYFSVTSMLPSFLDVNGRNFVWQDALEKIRLHPILGYGIDGVLLSTFWSKGFNYAHNQLIQNFLDGGIVLTVPFWIMIITFVKNTNKIKLVRFKVLCNVSLIALLAVMLFESMTLYVYMYIILSIIFSMGNLIKESQERVNNGCNYQGKADDS